MTGGRKPIPMEGLFFGRLEVLYESPGSTTKTKEWVAQCIVCKNIIFILGGNLRRIQRNGTSGCYCTGASKPRPRLFMPHVYGVWDGMMRRCYKPNHVAFDRYGRRGITVCPEWHDSKVFREWAIENGWEKGKQLDRIDNDLGYSPNNCRFVTPSVNQNNKSTNHRIVIDGESLTITEASRKFGINKTTIRERLRRGWTDSESVRPL